MSIKRKLFDLLLEPHLRYKGMTVSMFGLPAFNRYERDSLYSELSRLMKSKYVVRDGETWKLTEKGELYARSIGQTGFTHSLTKQQSKNLILMFDIPESRRKERNSLRKYLRNFHYVMIQKSVWVGPSPLPKEFLEYLNKTKLKNSIKTFKLAKGYTLK